jgi:hypothetical protein
VPTCSGEYKQQLVAFLDRFKSDNTTAAAKATSASVGSNLGSLSEGDEQQQQQQQQQQPDNEAAEDAEVPAGGRL